MLDFSNNSTISTINGSNNEIISKVSIARPVAIDIDPVNKILYMKHYDYPGISALDTFTGRIVEDVHSKRDIAFSAEPASGGNINCKWEDGSYYGNRDSNKRFRLDNDTEIACTAYSNWNYLFKDWKSNNDTIGNSSELRLKPTTQTMIVASFNQLIPSQWLELAALLGVQVLQYILYNRG